MAVFTDIKQLPSFRNAVITIGTFDGVHKGHKTILQEVVAQADQAGGESILLTFEPHPRKLLYPDKPLGIITPLDNKLQLIMHEGIEHVVVVPFTREFSNLSAREYIEQFLVGIFHPKVIIMGYDHRFGHDRKGNIDLLKEYAPLNGYKLVEIPAQLIDEAAISSTKIRHAIEDGRVDDAAHMLDRHYTLQGRVVHGKKLGRTIGYPTANIEPGSKDQIVPGIGIYAVYVSHSGTTYKGMMSIGVNPTVTDTKDIKIEVNIFDFSKEIYEEELEIRFVQKIREEQKFGSVEDLKLQLDNDRTVSLEVLRKV